MIKAPPSPGTARFRKAKRPTAAAPHRSGKISAEEAMQ